MYGKLGFLCISEWQHFLSTKENLVANSIYIELWQCVLMYSCSLMSSETGVSHITPLISFLCRMLLNFEGCLSWDMATCKYLDIPEDLGMTEAMVQGCFSLVPKNAFKRHGPLKEIQANETDLTKLLGIRNSISKRGENGQEPHCCHFSSDLCYGFWPLAGSWTKHSRGPSTLTSNGMCTPSWKEMTSVSRRRCCHERKDCRKTVEATTQAWLFKATLQGQMRLPFFTLAPLIFTAPLPNSRVISPAV